MATNLLETGNPVGMLELYLSVFTKGSCASEDGEPFLVKDFDPRRALLEASIKGLKQLLSITVMVDLCKQWKNKGEVYLIHGWSIY